MKIHNTHFLPCLLKNEYNFFHAVKNGKRFYFLLKNTQEFKKHASFLQQFSILALPCIWKPQKKLAVHIHLRAKQASMPVQSKVLQFRIRKATFQN